MNRKTSSGLKKFLLFAGCKFWRASWFIILLPLFLNFSNLFGADVSWDGGGGDSLWSTPDNWSNNNVPGADDDVTISLSARVVLQGADGFAQSIAINLGDTLIVKSGFNLDVGGNVTISGVMTLEGTASLDLEGDWVRTGEFNADSSTVKFDGSASQGVNLAASSDGEIFENFIVSKTAGSLLTLGSNIQVDGDLKISSGTLKSNGNYLTFGTNSLDSLVIAGKLDLDNSSLLKTPILKLADSSNLIVTSGGILRISGNSDYPTIVSHISGRYNFEINSGGELEARYYKIEYMDTDGIELKDGSIIDAADNLSDGTIDNIASGGTGIKIGDISGSDQRIQIYHVYFPNNPGSGSNVSKTASTDTVEFIQAYGVFAGDNFDNDPNNLVEWTNVIVSRLWTGAVNANWITAGNWSPAGIPSDTESVIIPDTTIDPTVFSNVSCKDLLIRNNGFLLVSSKRTLTVYGNLSIGDSVTATDGILTLSGTANIQLKGNYYKRNNSNLINNTSTIIFDGTEDQTINSGGVDDARDAFYNLTVNKSSGKVILGEAILVSGTFTISNGTFDANGYDMSVVQNWSNSGTFSSNSNLVSFIGNTGGPYTINSGSSAFYDFTVSGTAIYQLNSGLDVNDDFTISGDSLDTNGCNINVAGNLSITGGFSAGTGTVSFDGSTVQAISSTDVTFNNLTINNSAGISLSANIVVGNILTLTSGNITTGSNTLTLGTSTSSLGSLTRTSGTIIGNFKRWFAASTVSNVLFPIGTSDFFRPANISFTTAPTSGGTLTSYFIASDPGTAGLPLNDGITILNVAPEGYWTLYAGDGLSGGIYTLDLTANAFTSVGDPTTLRILKRPAGGGNWTLDGTHVTGTGTVETPVAHRSGMSGFSEFGIGGGADNPLPVMLTSFNGYLYQGQIILKWITESEIDNSHWIIERKRLQQEEYDRIMTNELGLQDSSQPFIRIALLKGQGTKSGRTEYEYIDNQIFSGEIYAYLLSDVSMSGAVTYHSPVFVLPNLVPEKFELSQNFPNPFNPTTTIQYDVPITAQVTITIYTILGQKVLTLVDDELLPGSYKIVWDTENSAGHGVASGTYFYQMNAQAVEGDNRFSDIKKMIIMR